MTQDDIENALSNAQVDNEVHSPADGDTIVSVDWVDIKTSMTKTIWDAALASADDALVLVQWLESKRG